MSEFKSGCDDATADDDDATADDDANGLLGCCSS